MNKVNLIDIVANKMDITKAEASEIVELVFSTIKESLKQKEDVNIGGFGLFMNKTRAARKGINPKSGERIDVPEHNIPFFRASAKLKRGINN